MYLLKDQQRVAKEYFDSTIFLDGIAGTGKTTAAIERVKNLLKNGVPAESILVLVPQAVLAQPYREALRRSRLSAIIPTATLGKLAYEMTDLFFPLIADEVGFENPLARPHFLSLELVQYYMARFLNPVIEQKDLFNSVHISRSRLYTQIVDNLNKAALVGFDYKDFGEKLKMAWRGDKEQEFIYEDAQEAANIFREMCRQYNLLDFSLQVSLFLDFIWTKPEPKRYLTNKYRHLIVDNIEEDSPATHQLLHQWLPHCESALIIYDSEAGYRRFLGADPHNAETLKDQCAEHITLTRQRVMSEDMNTFEAEMATSLKQPIRDMKALQSGDVYDAIAYSNMRYHPQMLDWAAESIAALVHNDGVPPSEIVVLAPYLPDALRFALQTRLTENDVPNRTHRPSRALRDEPAARTLLTLAKIAHPQWGMTASKFDLAYALTSTIADLDLVRARLLVDVLYQKGRLNSFAALKNERVQERITFDLGQRYDALLAWFTEYQADESLPIDAFFSRLFGEVLSQPHYGFHSQYDAANTAANLIDSAREFRQTISKIEPDLDTASEYIRMVDDGVIANQYMRDWELEKHDAVLIAPAYTFLLSNTSVDYQFWLNVGSNGWSQRILQPLTHPYVLSRQWADGRIWTDMDEVEANQAALAGIALGLIRRCRQQIYLGISQFSEQGYEQRGALLLAVHGMLRRLQKEGDDV